MINAVTILHTEISIFITVSSGGLKATVAIQSVTSKSISEIIGVELKEIRGYRTPPLTPQCITEIKNSRQFPKEISIRADTVAKHKTPKVAHTHLKYSLATPIHHSFVRRERFDTNLPFGKKIDTRRGHISIPGVVDGVS